MTTRNTHNWVSKTAEKNVEIVDVLSKADTLCRQCKPASPLHCVDGCDIWRTKNEFVEFNKILGRGKHMHNLLNTLKNSRRKIVMEALSERQYGTKGLQEYLKNNGYRHSKSTIDNEYVEPLIETGLVKRDCAKYHLTLYGTKLQQILSKYNIENPLPPHSSCYEEIVLRNLNKGPKSFAELFKSLTQKSLSRTLKRLLEKGLIIRNATSEYIFYFRTKKMPKEPFSPTEKRVYESISDTGISVHQLSDKVGINIRRTYKYLRKLRRRRLVFTRKKPRTYMLTYNGIKLADLLEETAKLFLDASNASKYMVLRSKKTDTNLPPPANTKTNHDPSKNKSTLERKEW